MLKEIITTCLIQMGVANVTPICDRQQAPIETALNETITTDYTLTLQQTSENYNTWSNITASNYIYPSITGQVTDGVTNYQKNNLALNVIATKYSSNVTTMGTPIRY